MFAFACLLLFCRTTIFLTFALSAWGKFRNMDTFRDALQSFDLLPTHWVSLAAWIFLIGECSVTLLLVIGGVLLPIGFVIAAILLALFTGALSLALARHLKVSCNCFSSSQKTVSPYDVVRNSGLILCCLSGLLAGFFSSDSLWTLPFTATLLLIIMAATVVMLLLNLADIVETLRKPLLVE